MMHVTPVTGPLPLLRRRAVSALISWLLLLSYFPLLVSCNYYRTKTAEVKPEELSQLATAKIFVVHLGPDTWELTTPQLNGEKLEGIKGELNPKVLPYSGSPPADKSPRYQVRDRKVALNIVHLHISDYQVGEGQQVSIPLSAVQRLDIVEENSGKTLASYVLGSIGVAMGATAIILVIIALTKSSCPFVYAYSGGRYQFVGETYGGAIFAPSERHDYMPLPDFQPAGQEYQLKITNELRERQFTNLAELVVVQHDAKVRVLLDQRGTVQTIGQPQAPTHAVARTSQEHTTPLASVDRNVFMFNDASPGASQNSLVMTFANPSKAKKAKLVLRAQNSLWLDYLYGEFTKKFGASYNSWASTQEHASRQELQQWSKDQGIPLTISVKTPQGWQVVERIPPVGPLAYRDMVVPLDIPASLGAEPVQLKLETGFMFWELDYAALDFSPNQPVQLATYQPQTARDELGRDQRANLLQDDNLYLAQRQAGTEVRLLYRATQTPPASTQRTTAFLHTKGYYEPIRNYEGLPKLAELYAFQKPGRFIEFSKEKYQESFQQQILASNK